MVYEDDHFIDTTGLVWNYSRFSAGDVEAFREGTLYNAYEMFGAHSCSVLGTEGYYFAVWAPNATSVSVVGAFNGWKAGVHHLFVRLDESGIWEGFIPRVHQGLLYKYCIESPAGTFEKADPFARYAELRPGKASVLYTSGFEWQDHEWMQHRKETGALNKPWSVYEVHLGSWMRPDKDNPNLYNTYHETAERLIPYLKGMGFTHVEFMPVMEHPYDGSWGYQCTGYFAPTSRFGVPDDFKGLVNALHQAGIGVILDWVPSHFPGDEHGLHLFDGYHTYEYADGRMGYHPDWQSYIFNYKRGEVQSFLLSSAYFWIKEYHADGLRVDAVNSIIRLDFSRAEGAWEPNVFGGNENLEASALLKKINKLIHHDFPDVQMIAEEASDWPGITHPAGKKGFGFGMKWMMGWMHDTFRYFKTPPHERPTIQDTLTFSIMYYYDEKFMLALSHDEVVHGKSPMIYKMPGNEYEQFANLRLLYAYMYLHPGAKLLFMGNEWGQTNEWNHQTELQWELLQYDAHNLLQECVKDLNMLYRDYPALHELQFQKKGFEWVSLEEREEGILVFKRMGGRREQDVLVCMNVCNHHHYGKTYTVKGKSYWKEIFNSNHLKYWGSGDCVNESIPVRVLDKKKRLYEIKLDIPALSMVVLH